MTDDTFFGNDQGDRTIIVPRPGGFPPPPPPSATTGPTGIPTAPVAMAVSRVSYDAEEDRNPILGCCSGLINYAAELRRSAQPTEDTRIYTEMVNDIKRITEQLKSLNLGDNVIVTARYMLCTFIDEMALNTPWGARSAWATQPLLSFFHKEAQGGVKFFDILRKLNEQPATYLDLLELAYVCLSLGYMGQYRLQANGAVAISQLQEDLYQTLRNVPAAQHPRYEDAPTLAPEPTLAATTSPLLAQSRTVWLVGACCLIVMALAFTGMLFKLNESAEPVLGRLSTLSHTLPASITRERAAQSNDRSGWVSALADDLASHRIDIRQTPDAIIISVAGAGLFEPASANLSNRALIERIAKALENQPGGIQVIGHTDNVPIRTTAFPSNWKLSEARAQAVAAVIRTLLPQRQLSIEGRADSEPLVANDSPDNRAKNRRVDIALLTR